MKKDNGYIVVETVGAFIPFVLLVISILSLVNIVTLQVRIHYAMTQTAGALSMYCYVLEAAGVSDELAAIDGKAGDFAGTVNEVLGGIDALSGGGDEGDIGRAFDAAQTMVGNPKEMIQGFMNYGINELKSEAISKLALPLFGRYLTNGKVSVDDYFNSLRVVSFDFADCSLIDRDENVKLTAEYEVEYTFGSLRLPFTPTLRISQTVVTKAWLGGSGEGYKNYE